MFPHLIRVQDRDFDDDQVILALRRAYILAYLHAQDLVGDVRRMDGTYVTSLRPGLLLAGIAAVADLLESGFTRELVQVRRILEPAAADMPTLPTLWPRKTDI